jgi:phosphatidylcholine synthase
MQNTYYEQGFDSGYRRPDGGSPSRKEQLLAWSAHLFTATGAIWGLLALLAITNEEWVWSFGWMGVAILVDSLDGILARRLRVKEILPGFDGALLDNMVDYLNYVFVPAFFLSQSDMLPPQIGLAGAVLILLASSYQFCQSDAKTADHYFKGFPSYWNIMVYYMFILSLGGWVNLAIVVLLSALVFVPIKYIYPSRTQIHRGLTLTLSALWGVVNVIILLTYPTHAPWLVWVSLIFALYYTGMSLYAMLRQPTAG